MTHDPAASGQHVQGSIPARHKPPSDDPFLQHLDHLDERHIQKNSNSKRKASSTTSHNEILLQQDSGLGATSSTLSISSSNAPEVEDNSTILSNSQHSNSLSETQKTETIPEQASAINNQESTPTNNAVLDSKKHEPRTKTTDRLQTSKSQVQTTSNKSPSEARTTTDRLSTKPQSTSTQSGSEVLQTTTTSVKLEKDSLVPTSKSEDVAEVSTSDLRRKESESLLLQSANPFDDKQIRRPSLEFLKLQREEKTPSVLPKILPVLPSIMSPTSSNEALPVDPLVGPSELPSPPLHLTSLPDAATNGSLTDGTNAQQQARRPSTSSSFLLGRTTQSGKIRFTQAPQPSEEILQRRLDQLDMTIANDELMEYADDEDEARSRLRSPSEGSDDAYDPPKTVDLGEELPDIEGLRVAIDLLSADKIPRLYDHCRMQDSSRTGGLRASLVLKAFIDIVPGASRRRSVWRRLIIELAPNDDIICYGKLLKTISDAKTGRAEEEASLPSLADMLITKDAFPLVASELPARPTTSQCLKEKGRAQVLLEIESILSRNPQIDIDRLKLATNQKVIDAEEMIEILDAHDLRNLFSPFLQRLLASFQTSDGRFHFAAFSGCLENLKPNVFRSSAPAVMFGYRSWEDETPLAYAPVCASIFGLFSHLVLCLFFVSLGVNAAYAPIGISIAFFIACCVGIWRRSWKLIGAYFLYMLATELLLLIATVYFISTLLGLIGDPFSKVCEQLFDSMSLEECQLSAHFIVALCVSLQSLCLAVNMFCAYHVGKLWLYLLQKWLIARSDVKHASAVIELDQNVTAERQTIA